MTKFYKSKGSTQLNCFSPQVMLATLTIEFALAFYALWRYKLNTLSRLITISLVALATFQVAEYFVCTGYGMQSEYWSRLGFAAISTLPVLGLHIFHKLAHKKAGVLVALAYATMVAFIVFFLTFDKAFNGYQCTGNYVIFQIGYRLGGLYAVYYYGWLIIGILLGAIWANQLRDRGAPALKQLESVRALILGYLVFLVPTTLANTVSPASRRAIPSIMCGFAVLFALILALYILPRMVEIKRRSRPS